MERNLLQEIKVGLFVFFFMALIAAASFILGGGKDIFVHITAVQRAGIPELIEGARLSFEIQPDTRGRGPQAINLQLSAER